MDLFLGILLESFKLTKAMALYLLIGFLFAGIIKVFFSERSIFSHLGKGKILSSLKASLVGIPLPICSCGVLPIAISLRRQGANKGATLSFLISTPVTGIDSILATYALLGGLFTGFRVVTSFFIALLCGVVANFLLKEDSFILENKSTLCFICGDKDVNSHYHTFLDKIKYVFKYAFDELLGDIAKWLVLGIVIGGIISYSVPENFIENYLGNSWLAMFLMLIVGIPIYVCATGSIPIAAALMLKGMSPGAALVFLLTGPATNTVSMAVISKELGKKALFLYLFFICSISILAGALLNKIWNEGILYGHIKNLGIIPVQIQTISAIMLIALISMSFFKRTFLNLKLKVKDRNLVNSAIDENTLIFNVPEMSCHHCVSRIEKALVSLEGINSFKIDLERKKVIISPASDFDKDKFLKQLASAGFDAHLERG